MIKKILKEMNEMRKMMGLSVISEQEGGGGQKTSSPRGGTGSGSAGSYISAGAFDPGGILTTSGRKKDRGELPEIVDITGGETGTFQTVDIKVPTDNIDTRASEQQKKEDDRETKDKGIQIFNPKSTYTDDNNPHDDHDGPTITTWDPDNEDPYDDRDPKKQRDPKGHNKTIRRAACCKKCKNGKFSNIYDDNNKKERGCVYVTISDCQLAKR